MRFGSPLCRFGRRWCALPGAAEAPCEALAAKAIKGAPQLTEEMTRADLVEVLEHLPLQGDCSSVCLDRRVVTYLTLREGGARSH